MTKKLLILYISFLVLFIGFYFSEFLVTNIYLRGLFQFIRVVHDYSLGFIPIPSIYIALGVLFLYLWIHIKKAYRKKSPVVFLIGFLKAILFLLICFYVLWGFNYYKPNFRDLINFDFKELPDFDINQAFTNQTDRVNQLIDIGLDSTYFLDLQYESLIREEMEDLLAEWEIPIYGRVRVRKLPGGSLLHLRTAGIYIPHALEGHFDGGLYNRQWPFTMAHEMAHGYGFTEEAVCNFIAYVVCTRIDQSEIQYSAELAYWRYLGNNVREDSIVQSNKEMLSLSVKNDLNQIRSHILRYKEWMPKSRDKIYDSYLKSHRVSAGIKSYDQMIELVETWKTR